MAKSPSPSDDPLDGMSREVDRLLKQLPGADPTLRGSSPSSPPVSGVRPGIVTTPGGAAISERREPTARDKLGVWLRVGLGVVAGAVMTQWPYAHACGFRLYLYLAAVAAVLVAGGWGSLSSWKLRMGVAHVTSLMVIFWGLVLAAQQVLPRIGYAAVAASWRCL
ncbi:MAG: hypothetical protein HYT81_05300 [Gemmatimonadetes bacterium]|nr:hypothetical protein [Gemmatimonadota bacterium]